MKLGDAIICKLIKLRTASISQPDPTSIGRTPFWASRQAQWPWQPHGIHNSCLRREIADFDGTRMLEKKLEKIENIAKKY
jgi:hypothetical protein